MNRPVDDDTLPAVYRELGGYIVGGFLGAKVSWGTGGRFGFTMIAVDDPNFLDCVRHGDACTDILRLPRRDPRTVGLRFRPHPKVREGAAKARARL